MTPTQLKFINALSDEMHFDLANTFEEIIDGEHDQAKAYITNLMEKLEDLRQNIETDEI